MKLSSSVRVLSIGKRGCRRWCQPAEVRSYPLAKHELVLADRRPNVRPNVLTMDEDLHGLVKTDVRQSGRPYVMRFLRGKYALASPLDVSPEPVLYAGPPVVSIHVPR
jgi:hypothetical protein